MILGLLITISERSKEVGMAFSTNVIDKDQYNQFLSV